jgi:hypothetical protein
MFERILHLTGSDEATLNIACMSATVPNRGSPPAILLRESYREGGKVKTRTLKNLSDWPAERLALLRAVLRGDKLVPAGEGVAIEQALPHGHVVAVWETARRIGLDRLLPRQGRRADAIWRWR